MSRFQQPINPFSDQFADEIDRVAASVAWWDEYRDDMARLANEPRRDGGGGEKGDTGIDAVVKSSATLGTNRWTYTCEPAEWDDTGKKWVTLTDTTDEYVAYNLDEMLNDGTAVLHGYVLDGEGYTLEVVAIPDDTPVTLRLVPGTTVYTFSKPNRLDVECDEGSGGFDPDFGVIT
jgi:hypothetical protein